MALVLVAPYKKSSVAVAAAALFDQYYDYNVAVMDFEGVNGATAFTDATQTSVFTRSGSAAISTTRSKYGTASLRIPQNSTIATAVSQEYNIGSGTGDFTFEGDFYYETMSVDGGGAYLFQLNGASDSLQFYTWGSTKSMPLYSSASGSYAFTPTHSMVAGRWYHIALVRSGSTYTTYIDGVLFATGTGPNAPTEPRSLQIGGGFFDGYVDNLRFTKGVARYSTAFTPKQNAVSFSVQNYDPFFDATVLQLHFEGAHNGTVFTDVKGKSVTRLGSAYTSNAKSRFGSTSAFFGTKADALQLPTSTDFDFTGDFTIEAWINPTDYSLSSEWGIFDSRSAGGTAAPLVFGLRYVAGTYRPYVYADPSNTIVGTSTSVPPGSWTHIALVRRDGVIKFYVNGVADATTLASTLAITSGTNPVIGHKDRAMSGYGTLGYIDEFRITKNVCRYNADFKPVKIASADTARPSPAEYDPYASNVKALLRFEGANNGAVFTDEVSGRTYTRTNTGIYTSTTLKKYGSSALRSTLGGNILTSDTSADFNLSGDFTVEMYVNMISMPSGQVNHDFIRFDGAARGFNPCFYIWGAGSLLVLRASQTTGDMIVTPHSMTTGVWYHLAFSRIGNTFMTFINGVMQGSYTNASSVANEDKNFVLGNFDGYMDELRITKGACRYTGPFTPPAYSHPALSVSPYANMYPSDPFQSNTVLHLAFDRAGITDTTGVTEMKSFGTGINRVRIDTNSFVENASAYFSGQVYLESNASTRFRFGTSDFTIESWIRPTTRSVGVIFETHQTASVNNIGLQLDSSGRLVATSATTSFITTTESLILGVWSHVVLQRSGTELSIWINGIKVKTVANTTNFSEGIARIGRSGSTGNYFTGWIDNLRVTKAARYTTSFTPQITM